MTGKSERSNTELSAELADDIAQFHISQLEHDPEIGKLEQTISLLLNQLEEFSALQVSCVVFQKSDEPW